MGKVDFGSGVLREACLAYLEDIEIGDYTIIHVGFALSKIDEEEAHKTLALLRELSMMGDEIPELDEQETPQS